MVEMIDTLRREHIIIAELLNILEREFLILRIGGQVNYKLIKLLISYFTASPDSAHHRKEDLVYRKLKFRLPQALSELVNLEEEHKELDELLERFANAVAQVDHDRELRGETVLGAVENYVEFARAHIKKEEKGFLPLAEKNLLPEDWAEISYSIASFIKSSEYRECVSNNKTLYRWIKAVDSSMESKHVM